MKDRTRLLSWSEHDQWAPRAPTEVECAKALVDQRRARAKSFGSNRVLFYDPAWEIMLELFIAHEEGRSVTSASLKQLVEINGATLHRWLRAMEHEGVTACWPADSSAEGIVVALTPKATEMMLRFLSEV